LIHEWVELVVIVRDKWFIELGDAEFTLKCENLVFDIFDIELVDGDVGPEVRAADRVVRLICDFPTEPTQAFMMVPKVVLEGFDVITSRKFRMGVPFDLGFVKLLDHKSTGLFLCLHFSWCQLNLGTHNFRRKALGETCWDDTSWGLKCHTTRNVGKWG